MSKSAQMWERVRTVPGLGPNVVALTAMTVVGIACALYIVSNYAITFPWQQRYVFSALFEKAPGLNVQSTQEVRIAGVPVGEITGATPEDGGTARLTLSLEPGHPVYTDARLEYRTKTPLNVPYVALDPGTPAAGELPEGAVVPASQTSRHVQPWEVLNKLDQPTQEALTALLNESQVALADAPATLPAGLRAADDTLETLQPVVVSLQERRATIERLVTALSQISTAAGDDDRRLASLVTSLQETLGALTARDDDLGATLDRLPGVTGALREAMARTSELTAQLDPTLDNLAAASDELPGALARTRDAVEEVDEVVDAGAPVVAAARPVVADLRPLAGDARAALEDLRPVADDLPNAVERIAPWMPNLAAFVYQTSSAFSLHDANGGLGRAQIVVDVSNPAGGLQTDPPEGGTTTPEGGN